MILQCDVQGVFTCIEVKGSDTVKDLRRKILEEVGVEGRLVWEGEELGDDGVGLSTMGLLPDDVVRVCVDEGTEARLMLQQLGVRIDFDTMLQNTCETSPAAMEKTEYFSRLPVSFFTSSEFGHRGCRFLYVPQGGWRTREHAYPDTLLDECNARSCRIVRKLAHKPSFVELLLSHICYWGFPEVITRAFLSECDPRLVQTSVLENRPYVHIMIGFKRKWIDLLLDFPNHVNWATLNDNSRTPFSAACYHMPDFAMTMLDRLPHAADVDTMDGSGNTPLHMACRRETQHTLPLIKALVKLGAGKYINVANKAGHTPLVIACKSGSTAKVVEYLLSQGAGLFLKIREKTVAVFTCPIRHEAVLHAVLAAAPDVTKGDVKNMLQLRHLFQWKVRPVMERAGFSTADLEDLKPHISSKAYMVAAAALR